MAEIEEVKAGIQSMFSADAVRYGDLLFVSGCVPMDSDGELVGEGDLEQQTLGSIETRRQRQSGFRGSLAVQPTRELDDENAVARSGWKRRAYGQEERAQRIGFALRLAAQALRAGRLRRAVRGALARQVELTRGRAQRGASEQG